MSEQNGSAWMEDNGKNRNVTAWSEGNMEEKPAVQDEVRNAIASGSNFVNGAVSEGAKQQNTAYMETEETKRMKENFHFFGPAAFIYSVFYVFCLFHNKSGITYPFFVAGSLLFMRLSLSKLGMSLKKGSKFYMAAIILLGISTFCTADTRIISYNKLGCFLLMMSLLLKQFCNTEKWRLGKFLGSICVMIVAVIGELNRPISDAAAHRKNGGKKLDKRFWYGALGLLIGVPLTLAVLLLLASADAIFREMTKKILANINLYNIISVMIQMVFVYFASYALIAWLCSRKLKDEVVYRRTGEPVLAITITTLLTLIYLLFSGIQIAALFLGRMSLPQGYTYAMYAREGFFQLLGVSILNLVIVLLCMSYFRESTVLKVVLTVMSLCTFVMIASSALRMIMYIRFYYLTFQRILVLWALVTLAVLFAGVVINIFKENFSFFRYGTAVVTVLYLVLSFAHPDYIIARVNVANAPGGSMAVLQGQGGNSAVDTYMTNDAWNEGGEERFFLASKPYEDYYYLRTLCADAAPVLVPYLKELGYELEAFHAENPVSYVRDKGLEFTGAEGFGYDWMKWIKRDIKGFGVRTYNVSRHIALLMFRRYM